MQGQHNLTVSDAEFNRRFELNHGAAAREYYALRPPTGSSQWVAITDWAIKRGQARQTKRNGGAE